MMVTVQMFFSVWETDALRLCVRGMVDIVLNDLKKRTEQSARGYEALDLLVIRETYDTYSIATEVQARGVVAKELLRGKLPKLTDAS